MSTVRNINNGTTVHRSVFHPWAVVYFFAYKTCDKGKTLITPDYVDVSNRSFDKYMLLEFSDGRLQMLVRTNYGIGVSYSSDRGKSWTPGCDSAAEFS